MAKPQIQQIPLPAGAHVQTGPVMIGDQFGWFVSCDEPGRRLPRLLDYAALAVEHGMPHMAASERTHRQDRWQADLMRKLAARLGSGYRPGEYAELHRLSMERLRQRCLHATSLGVTEQHMAAAG